MQNPRTGIFYLLCTSFQKYVAIGRVELSPSPLTLPLPATTKQVCGLLEEVGLEGRSASGITKMCTVPRWSHPRERRKKKQLCRMWPAPIEGFLFSTDLLFALLALADWWVARARGGRGQLCVAFSGSRREGTVGTYAAKMKFTQFLMKNGSVFGSPQQVERFSKFCPSPLSMKQFLDFGEFLAQLGRSVGHCRPSFIPSPPCTTTWQAFKSVTAFVYDDSWLQILNQHFWRDDVQTRLPRRFFFTLS